MTISTVLSSLYASGGDKAVILDTLQINIGDEVLYLVRGYDDIAAMTEDGTAVTFKAANIEIALPKRNSEGTQDLQFALSNVFGEVSSAVRAALQDLSKATITFRRYTSDDLNAPASPPYTLKVKSGQWNAADAQIIAGYANVLDTAWPRLRYTLANYPGLRYLQ